MKVKVWFTTIEHHDESGKCTIGIEIEIGCSLRNFVATIQSDGGWFAPKGFIPYDQIILIEDVTEE